MVNGGFFLSCIFHIKPTLNETCQNVSMYMPCRVAFKYMVIDHFFLVMLQACSQEYLQIVESFGDSADESCPFSIHSLLEVGSSFGLAAGSWLGPYALCRTLEALAQGDRERHQKRGGQQVLPMVVHVVSGDADGERGGAPVLCVEDVTHLCSKWGEHAKEWPALLVLVPLVLGLDKVNPRLVKSFSLAQICGNFWWGLASTMPDHRRMALCLLPQVGDFFICLVNAPICQLLMEVMSVILGEGFESHHTRKASLQEAC